MTRQGLTECIAAIRGADRAVMDAARRRQAELAKPPGSLGRLEDYSVRMAGITGEVKPTLEKCRVLVLAADNGVVAEGVSSAPQSVTLQQVLNMTRYKTGMSSLAHYFGDDVVVTDVGVNAEIKSPGVLARKVRYGTGNIARERAMSEEETLRAMAIGMELAAQAKRDGVGAVGIGEMGIGNTTTSSAVLAALTGAPVEALTGRGGGLTDSAQAKAQASCDPQGFLSHNDSDYRTSKVSKIYRSAPRRAQIVRPLFLIEPDGSAQLGAAGTRIALHLSGGGRKGLARQHLPARADPAIEILLGKPVETAAAHEILHRPVFQRMIGDHDQTPARTKYALRLLEHHPQSLHLAVHLDTQRLKQLREELALGPPGSDRRDAGDQFVDRPQRMLLAAADDAGRSPVRRVQLA